MTARGPMVALALLLGLAPWTCAEPDPAGFIHAYLRARDAKSVGEIAGRAIGDGARPTAPPTPYEGVSVLLLPASSELQAELDAIKAHARDSLKQYMDVTADLTEAREMYERTLR